MFERRSAAISLAALALAVSACQETAAPPAAEKSPETPSMAELVEIRHDNFEAIGKANKAIKKELERDAPDLAAVEAAAAEIAGRGARIIGYFPAGSGPDAGLKTEALPTIWEKPAEFTAAADKLVASANALRNAAKGGDAGAAKAAATTMSGSCQSCHDNFRRKKS